MLGMHGSSRHISTLSMTAHLSLACLAAACINTVYGSVVHCRPVVGGVWSIPKAQCTAVALYGARTSRSACIIYLTENML